jgi:rhodanese-related sulfurtransferase
MRRDVPLLSVQDLAGFVADQAAHQPANPPVLLDVREAWELQTARLDLPGATTLHIPMHTLPARLHELRRTQPILGLCHHGARSWQCVAFLQQQGFEAVYNVAGGIDAWSRDVDHQVPRY